MHFLKPLKPWKYHWSLSAASYVWNFKLVSQTPWTKSIPKYGMVDNKLVITVDRQNVILPHGGT